MLCDWATVNMLSGSRQKARKFYIEVTYKTKRQVYSASYRAVNIHFLTIIYESRYKGHDIIFLRCHKNRDARATLRYIVGTNDCTADK